MLTENTVFVKKLKHYSGPKRTNVSKPTKQIFDVPDRIIAISLINP